MDERAEDREVPELPDSFEVRLSDAGHRRGDDVERRKCGVEGDAFVFVMIGERGLERAVPSVDRLIENRRDAAARMQRDPAAEHAAPAADARPPENLRRMHRPRGDDHRLRVHGEA